MLRGLVVLRWGTLAWSVGVVVVGADRLARPWLAALLLGAALVVTIIGTRAVSSSLRPLPAWFVITELGVGFAMLALEGFAFDGGHAFAGRQGLAGGWPVVGVIGAGFSLGPAIAAPAGAFVGLGRLFGAWANGVGQPTGDQWASLLATVAFYALYGAVAGWVGHLLRRAEEEVATTRARDEVARTLHDGVLQTLALVERRTATSDPTLARLARDTDRDLRSFLYGPVVTAGAGWARGAPLGPALREAARRAARPFDLDISVSVVGEPATLTDERLRAVTGAVAEAVANVGKHARARRAVVFADADGEGDGDGGLFVSVRDDGVGFDPGRTPPGQGLTQSVHARMALVGGRAEVVSAPGHGTEVRLWLP